MKYGDTLRRLSARVDENNRLDLNMVGLRAKICSIFNFTADANLILRYVDEDGDLVNLVDDDDLHDVMRQQLRFLRIDVHRIGDCGGKSDAGSSGSATPLRSPPVSNPSLGENFVKADVLHALPEPLREVLYSSLLKAASSSPVLANLADSISKIGQSILNSHCQPGVTSTKNGDPEESVTSEAKGPQSPCVDVASDASVHARSSGSAIPLRSPVSDPFMSGNVIIADVLYSMPEPVHEALSNLSLSKDASSSHVLPNVTDSISKMGQSTLNSHCQPHVTVGPSSINDVSEEPMTLEARGLQSPFLDSASNAPQHVETGHLIRGIGAISNASPQVETGNRTSGGVVAASNASPQVEVGNLLRGVVAASNASQHMEARNRIRGTGAASDASRQEEARNRIRGVVAAAGVAPVDLNILPWYSRSSTNVNSAPLSSAVPGSDDKGKMSIDDSFAGKGERCGTSTGSAGPNNSPTQTPAMGFRAPIDCPFSGTNNFHSVAPPLGNCRIPPFKRSHSHTEAMSGMFHKGVRCDGCGVYPITGPRFKSKM